MNHYARICFCIVFLFRVSFTCAQTSICMLHNTVSNTLSFDTNAFNQFIKASDYDAFFFGEQHNTSFDPLIKYQLITTLNATQGIRDIFMEAGHAAVWCFNKYLQTGDTAYLYTRKLVFASGGYQQFWQDLYKYNQNLPSDKKLVIHGTDFERTDAFLVLQRLATKEPTPALKAFADTIAAHANDAALEMYQADKTPIKSFMHIMKGLKETFVKNMADAQTYFGNNYPIAKDILLNEGIQTSKPLPRNKTMYAELTRQLSGKPVRFVFFIGRTHASLFMKSSLPNLAEKGGFKTVTINEILYDLLSSTVTSAETKKVKDLIPTGSNCKAVLMKAADVPTHHIEADYMLISSK